jgi:hypothetical protein
MGRECSAHEVDAHILVVNPEGKDHLEDLGVEGRIILKWI